MSERKPNLWCLFCKSDGRVIEGLLFDEARAFISNLDSTQLEYWYAWKDEWPDWRSVNQVVGLTEMIYRLLPVSPPPPPKGTEESSLRLENSNSQIHQTPQGNDRNFPQTETTDIVAAIASDFIVRNKKRFKKRMQITVVLGTRIFRTYTKDISVGGMNVEDSLPDWVSGQFKVRIAKPNSKQLIELTCCLIDNQPNGGRFRLAILPLQSIDDEKNLEIWLAA